jgi:hypothetical protein
MGILNGREEEERSPSASADQGLSEKDIEQQAESNTQDGAPQPRQFDRAMERKVVRKIDLHLIPLVMVLCGWYIRIGRRTG